MPSQKIPGYASGKYKCMLKNINWVQFKLNLVYLFAWVVSNNFLLSNYQKALLSYS